MLILTRLAALQQQVGSKAHVDEFKRKIMRGFIQSLMLVCLKQSVAENTATIASPTLDS